MCKGTVALILKSDITDHTYQFTQRERPFFVFLTFFNSFIYLFNKLLTSYPLLTSLLPSFWTSYILLSYTSYFPTPAYYLFNPSRLHLPFSHISYFFTFLPFSHMSFFLLSYTYLFPLFFPFPILSSLSFTFFFSSYLLTLFSCTSYFLYSYLFF